MIPDVSVLMGVYYRRENLNLLQRSIQSVLGQSFSNFEFLICDDGSSKAARACVRMFAEKDSRVRIIERNDLFSLSAKLNACLRAARGSFIARMDDDDFAHADRFEKQVAYLSEHLKIDFIGSNVNLSRDGEIIGIRQLPEQPQIRDFLFTQPFVHPALMFRREALHIVGGYSENKSCRKCEDYDLLLRLYENGCRGANLQECLLDYTVPNTAKGSRTMRDRWNETVTRCRRFHSLKLLPKDWPFVMKPLVVGLLPEAVLARFKNKCDYRDKPTKH